MTQLENITIRKAEKSDYERVCVLFGALDEYHEFLSPQQYQPFDGPPRSRSHYLRLLTNPDGFFFVAEIDESLVGFINGAMGDTPPYPMFKPKRFVGVTNLFVHAGQRGAGIGLELLKQAREWGGEKDVTAMRLDVIADNEIALAFYKHLGFSQIRSTLEIDGRFEPE